MNKLILLFVTLLVGMVFMVVPETNEPKDFFLLSNMKIHAATHVYFIGEKLVLVILAYIVASEERIYKMSVQAFFFLTVMDLIDYILSYNAVWFRVGFPVSINTFSAFIFTIVTLREWTLKQYPG